ncbi:MAG: sugar ABC transporter permease [Candidatus Hydrogenedentes bacterium]|nr:sugar ABC transporter permease [Candidatus Hydrogenedentota bacterium]
MTTDRTGWFGHRFRLTLTCYALLATTLVLLGLFVYIPVVWAFSNSLYQFEVGGDAQFIGLRNYREFLFEDAVTWPSILNMAILTLLAVAVRLTIPLVVAKLICALPHERGRYLYRLLFLIPIVVPAVAIQLIWMNLVYAERGLVNETLIALGLGDWARGWLSDPRTALVAVAMVGFPFVFGFEVLIYYAGLANIPASVNEAALLEGCAGIRKFLLIDVPMVMSQLKLIVILTIIGGLQSFEGLIILTQGGPGFKTTVPGLWMYYNAFSFQRFGYACAIGVCLFVVIFGLTVLNLRYFKSTEELEGVR